MVFVKIPVTHAKKKQHSKNISGKTYGFLPVNGDTMRTGLFIP